MNVNAYAETQAYQRAVQESTPATSAEDAGVERGWKAGYEAAFNQVMGHLGAPAQRSDDEMLPLY